MLKIVILQVCLISLVLNIVVGQNIGNYPEFSLSSEILEQHLRFLASDELMGRRTGSSGNNAAARYIAEQFRRYGVEVVEGQEDYFQPLSFLKHVPGEGGSLKIGDHQYIHGDSMLWLSGKAAEITAKAVWLGHGWVNEEEGYNDYEGKDVKGKIVVVASGAPGAQDRRESFMAMPIKRKWASEHGARALIEIYQINAPWSFFNNYFSRERLNLLEGNVLPQVRDTIPYGWVFGEGTEWLNELRSGTGIEISINSNGANSEIVASNNVIGIIPGSDPDLKDEYVLLTAHYDHVGVGEQGGRYTAEDSIFNGARDNGMGTVALLAAAQSLAKLPAKRSVIVMALTAEEIGLLGSAYYADNPLVPLDQVIYNLNTDGAGYSDTSAVSILGYDRVGTEKEFEQATAAFGLKIYADPAKEQNLFDRSDNVSFARKGIPSPTFSPGFEDFGPEIFKYYHQVTDEVDDINWSYLRKFAQAYTYTARLIANRTQRPFWVEGDKYEEVGKQLYKR